MTNIDKIYAHIVYHTDLRKDHRIDAISVLDINHVHIQKTDHFKNTLLHIDLHRGLDNSRPFRPRSHSDRKKTK